jgi:transcription elongation factor SPT6
MSNLFLFRQLSEELTGYPPTDKTTIEEESSWIHNYEGFLFFFGIKYILTRTLSIT